MILHSTKNAGEENDTAIISNGFPLSDKNKHTSGHSCVGTPFPLFIQGLPQQHYLLRPYICRKSSPWSPSTYYLLTSRSHHRSLVNKYTYARTLGETWAQAPMSASHPAVPATCDVPTISPRKGIEDRFQAEHRGHHWPLILYHNLKTWLKGCTSKFASGMKT